MVIPVGVYHRVGFFFDGRARQVAWASWRKLAAEEVGATSLPTHRGPDRHRTQALAGGDILRVTGPSVLAPPAGC
jgi:hypothetical protein